LKRKKTTEQEQKQESPAVGRKKRATAYAVSVAAPTFKVI